MRSISAPEIRQASESRRQRSQSLFKYDCYDDGVMAVRLRLGNVGHGAYANNRTSEMLIKTKPAVGFTRHNASLTRTTTALARPPCPFFPPYSWLRGPNPPARPFILHCASDTGSQRSPDMRWARSPAYPGASSRRTPDTHRARPLAGKPRHHH